MNTKISGLNATIINSRGTVVNDACTACSFGIEQVRSEVGEIGHQILVVVPPCPCNLHSMDFPVKLELSPELQTVVDKIRGGVSDPTTPEIVQLQSENDQLMLTLSAVNERLDQLYAKLASGSRPTGNSDVMLSKASQQLQNAEVEKAHLIAQIKENEENVARLTESSERKIGGLHKALDQKNTKIRLQESELFKQDAEIDRLNHKIAEQQGEISQASLREETLLGRCHMTEFDANKLNELVENLKAEMSAQKQLIEQLQQEKRQRTASSYVVPAPLPAPVALPVAMSSSAPVPASRPFNEQPLLARLRTSLKDVPHAVYQSADKQFDLGYNNICSALTNWQPNHWIGRQEKVKDLSHLINIIHTASPELTLGHLMSYFYKNNLYGIMISGFGIEASDFRPFTLGAFGIEFKLKYYH
ncbi:MAG: hypothetical protein ACHQUC_05650 [Chlamydiales bacterium]